MDKIITNIITKKYIAKFNKYVVELGIKHEEKQTVWLSEKQMDNLEFNFNKTPKGYSTKYITVIGVFNNNGYFMYSKLRKTEKKRYFKVPKEHDLSDLWEED